MAREVDEGHRGLDAQTHAWGKDIFPPSWPSFFLMDFISDERSIELSYQSGYRLDHPTSHAQASQIRWHVSWEGLWGWVKCWGQVWNQRGVRRWAGGGGKGHRGNKGKEIQKERRGGNKMEKGSREKIHSTAKECHVDTLGIYKSLKHIINNGIYSALAVP